MGRRRSKSIERDDPTLTVGSDSTRLLDDGPVGSLESGNTTGRELGEVVVPLGGLHVDHDELDVATSEDGGGTGTGDTPVVCDRERGKRIVFMSATSSR